MILRCVSRGAKSHLHWRIRRNGAAMESNHPGVGLPPPAGFEDRMGHQTPAAPRASVAPAPRQSVQSPRSHVSASCACGTHVARRSWEQVGPPGLLLCEGGETMPYELKLASTQRGLAAIVQVG